MDKKNAGAARKNVYLAGPFFNERQIKNIEFAEKVLAQKGFAFFSPMRHGADTPAGTPEWARQIFAKDRSEIDRADLIVALYDGSDSDSGTAWECGYAFACGKPVLLVHTDREKDSNLMMHCGCASNIYLDELETYDFDAMPAREYTGVMF